MNDDEYKIARMEYLLEWEGWSVNGPEEEEEDDHGTDADDESLE